ncbi:MAG: type II toxin-antitoxin system VapC family toxin [Vulcanimicrobiota bacterium]
MMVMDSYALVAFLEQEKGADRVEELFREAQKTGQRLFMSIVNWGEVYYLVFRERGEKKATEVLFLIEQLPLEIIDAGREITLRAARLKAQYSLAYADCFAAALAVERGIKVITGDKEFIKLSGEVDIEWL